MPPLTREYDITVLGATGWTAAICAEHITRTFPTTLKWCLAGRSRSKLLSLSDHLRALNPDRLAPVIHTIPELTAEQLNPLAQQTKILINGIGPYHAYSTPVVAACASSGTHYVDFSTETPWIVDMVKSYDSIAKGSGAIIIPAISNCSSPSDLVAWMLATWVKGNQPPGETINHVLCSGRLTMLGMQGGSLMTLLGVAEKYGIGQYNSGDAWAMSSQQRPQKHVSWPSQRLTGYLYDDTLGHLTTSIVAGSNEAVVQRSAGLKPDLYGPDFTFREYQPASGMMGAILVHILTKLGILLLATPWFRAFLRWFSYEPGSGPDRETSRKKERMDFSAIGFLKGHRKPVAAARFTYNGALVDISAILAVEAAGTLLELNLDSNSSPLRPRGMCTPSTLGMPFVERLRQVGVEILVEPIFPTVNAERWTT
ncbi:uncharacterized protein BCR38DRAFT_345954 [Pseudomassariella vexata]|uniref:Saccharopine dehydrogenase NADP binding domain-containing protein n=1 Tax=Pseudomassariella vexata TaxID=1141098 RepID=A0A1Y2DU60_9PEZI|nr:uncharacterized protein BCR38DRAFT_345954 [Pseudomassariella vexata]ORY62676.1 hypothetical protein BCR38DRAFT_345954 [Pseudomassariella vexata]